MTGNIIHDIHIRQLFTGAEMAGIRFHGAIDTEISRNRIYRTSRGLWLDWMAQGPPRASDDDVAGLHHDLAVKTLETRRSGIVLYRLLAGSRRDGKRRALLAVVAPAARRR